MTRDLDEKAVVIPFCGPTDDEEEEEEDKNEEQATDDQVVHLEDRTVLNEADDESWD